MTRSLTLLLALIIAIVALSPAAATAAQDFPAVHQERISAGPYDVTVGFSEWPIRAERSVDITFLPADGIAGKTATVTLISPTGDEWSERLGRHPRHRDLWGLDLIALPEAGPWTIGVAIDGPAGPGSGQLAGVTLLERPGPPVAPFWLVGLLPLAFLFWITIRAWRAVRPSRLDGANAWS
jgi:hypothetical protein